LLRNSRLGSRDAGKGKLGTDGNVRECAFTFNVQEGLRVAQAILASAKRRWGQDEINLSSAFSVLDD